MNHRRRSAPFERTRLAGVDLAMSGTGGPPLLLLHGIGGCADSFGPQLAALGAHRHVLAWDAPGYGASPDLRGTPALEDYAQVVLDVVRALDVGPVHVLGVSWGGVIALRAALRAPEALRSLALAGSSRGSGRSATAAAAMRRRVDERTERGPVEFARRSGPRLVAPAADPAVAAHVVDVMSGLRLPGYANAARSMAGADLSAVLGEVAVPTLVLVGDEDGVTGVDESRHLAEGIPGARMVRIADAGHAANQERPAEFNDAVERFLTDVDDPAGETGGLP
ncbi:alpha/beta fold hydrolase [Bounagaea algeriensis]